MLQSISHGWQNLGSEPNEVAEFRRSSRQMKKITAFRTDLFLNTYELRVCELLNMKSILQKSMGLKKKIEIELD
jgi:hypothetical protein